MWSLLGDIFLFLSGVYSLFGETLSSYLRFLLNNVTFTSLNIFIITVFQLFFKSKALRARAQFLLCAFFPVVHHILLFLCMTHNQMLKTGYFRFIIQPLTILTSSSFRAYYYCFLVCIFSYLAEIFYWNHFPLQFEATRIALQGKKPRICSPLWTSVALAVLSVSFRQVSAVCLWVSHQKPEGSVSITYRSRGRSVISELPNTTNGLYSTTEETQ